jgi:hypothetical protein
MPALGAGGGSSNLPIPTIDHYETVYDAMAAAQAVKNPVKRVV